MSDKYIVALKLRGKVNPFCYGGYTYLKARPVDDEVAMDLSTSSGSQLLPEPVVGKKYYSCHLITSPVVEFKTFGNGWEVQTENSLYRFILASRGEIERIVQENGFSGPKGMSNVPEAMYWN
jgi:hypothetical protein